MMATFASAGIARAFFAVIRLPIVASLLAFYCSCLPSDRAFAQTITVYSGGSVEIGKTRGLTAYVPLSPNTVTWSVNGVAGGNATVGTVSLSGLYTAPATVPTPNAVTVKATSTAYSDKSGAVTITVTQPAVQLWSVSPTTVAVGNFSIRLNGANFTQGSVVYAGDQPLTTSYSSSTSLTATGSATAAQAGQKINVTVRNSGNGGTTSSAVALQVGTDNAGGTPTPPSTPVSVSLSPASASVALGATQQFTAAVSGSTTTAVNYAVNGITGGNDTLGTISSTGLYRAPTAVPPGTIVVRATSAASSSATASANVTVLGPPNPGTGLGTPNLAAGRFLEQASFGPKPADLTRFNQIGLNAWLDEQFGMLESPIPLPPSDPLQNGVLRAQYLNRLATAPDQLRQRVATALGSIIVISMNKNLYPNEIVPYMRLLSRHAFNNYRDLLDSVTTSAEMGKFLDLANSRKPAPGNGANENYARELMQLFTIGLVELNQDGTPKLDGTGKTIPTYDQAAVQQVALALTGWTYAGPNATNNENFSGPMKPAEAYHDTRAKSFLGCNLPANQNTTQDKDSVLDCLFNHPNTAPFISVRLIRALVTSNPSPAYVGRVSAVFADNGVGKRGDLKAVVRAILTDSEARNDSAVAAGGRLKDHIYHVVALARALNGAVTATNQLSWQFTQMGQNPLTPPSVFGFYSPLYRAPKSSQIGPEFQIYTPTESVLRANMLWQIIASPGGDFATDLTPFTAVAGDTVKLIDAVDQALLYGRMPQSMRQGLADAITAQADNTTRVRTALYLTALSGLYAMQF